MAIAAALTPANMLGSEHGLELNHLLCRVPVSVSVAVSVLLHAHQTSTFAQQAAYSKGFHRILGKQPHPHMWFEPDEGVQEVGSCYCCSQY
jgi:hypothetical protein